MVYTCSFVLLYIDGISAACIYTYVYTLELRCFNCAASSASSCSFYALNISCVRLLNSAALCDALSLGACGGAVFVVLRPNRAATVCRSRSVGLSSFVQWLELRVATNLENMEKSGNLKVIREKSGKCVLASGVLPHVVQ